MKTLQDHYKLIKEGKGHKDVFLKEAKQLFPNYIRNAATFNEASNILKDKNVISENVVSLEPINTITRKKESYETAFENFLEESRKKNDNDPNAEIKKVSQQVEDKLKHNFDRTDKKNPDNHIFGEIMRGYYCEMKDPKNINKTENQLRDIVLKNLTKDPIYYTKNGMFGEKGVGVEMDVPGLGEPKEPKGKYKSSGYGDLKEGIGRNYPNFLDSEYQGETIPITGDELYTFLVDTMALSRNVDDFIQKVTYGLTDETSTLSSENEEKLRNWWGKNYNTLEEQKFRKLIREIISEELNTEEFKNTLYKLEQPYLDDKEALDDIQKIYLSHIQGLNSIRQNLKESVEKELLAINKEAESEVISTKLEKIDAAIEKRQSQLNKLDEDEDMKALTDKTKIKQAQKDIKTLERAKDKLEKTLLKIQKKSKKKIPSDIIDEAEGDVEDAKTTADEIERAAKAAKEISDLELFEEGETIDIRGIIKKKYKNIPNEDITSFINMHSQDIETKEDVMDQFEEFLTVNPEILNLDEGENNLPQEIINQIIPMYAEEGMEIEDIASMYPEMYNEVVEFLEGYDLGLDYDI